MTDKNSLAPDLSVAPEQPSNLNFDNDEMLFFAHGESPEYQTQSLEQLDDFSSHERSSTRVIGIAIAIALLLVSVPIGLGLFSGETAPNDRQKEKPQKPMLDSKKANKLAVPPRVDLNLSMMPAVDAWLNATLPSGPVVAPKVKESQLTAPVVALLPEKLPRELQVENRRDRWRRAPSIDKPLLVANTPKIVPQEEPEVPLANAVLLQLKGKQSAPKSIRPAPLHRRVSGEMTIKKVGRKQLTHRKRTTARPKSEVVGAKGLIKSAKNQAKRGRYKQAAALYKKALQQSPGSVAARFGLGKAYFELGKNRDAERFLAGVVRSQPSNGRALLMLASIYQTTARRSRARTLYQRYLQRFPSGRYAPEIQRILNRI